MYKTVRHGENSLQYTILPQQDDAASVVAANICGRSSAGVRRRARRGRTATILIMTLILACGVVGAAVVVPLLVSSDLVALPTALRRISSNNHHHGHRSHHSAIIHRNKTVHGAVHNDTTQSSVHPTSEENFITAASTVSNYSNVKPTTRRDFTESTTTEKPSTTEATSTTTRQLVPLDVGGILEDVESANEHDHVGGSKKKALQDDRNSTTVIFVSASIVGNITTIPETTRQVIVVEPEPTVHPKHRSWLEPRWPFADPSAYFQWTGYNGRDSLLLPLILGGAMLVLLTAICICYSIRRRRQKKLRRQTIGKISSDLQCGDKTTLLPDGSEEE